MEKQSNPTQDDRPPLLPTTLPESNQPMQPMQSTPRQEYVYEEVEVPAERGGGFGSGCGWGLAAAGGCLAIPLLFIAVAILIGVATIDSVFDGLGSIFQAEPRTATVVTSQTVVTSVQQLGQLVSVSAELAKADIQVTVRDGFQNACGRTANHVAQGAVEAGIDLTQLSEGDVVIDETTTTITLPHPQLTSCRIDFIQQYDRSSSVCGASWDNIRLLANYTTLVEFRDDALEGGILDRAREEAQVTLTNFLQLATGRTVIIQFEEEDPGAGTTLPGSCQPDPPFDWVYIPEEDAWRN